MVSIKGLGYNFMGTGSKWEKSYRFIYQVGFEGLGEALQGIGVFYFKRYIRPYFHPCKLYRLFTNISSGHRHHKIIISSGPSLIIMSNFIKILVKRWRQHIFVTAVHEFTNFKSIEFIDLEDIQLLIFRGNICIRGRVCYVLYHIKCYTI